MLDSPPARILAVTDLSPAGDVALAEAFRRAREEHAALAIVHAIPTVDAVRPLFPHRLVDDALWASQLPARAEATLRNRLEHLAGGTPGEVFLERGSTAEGAMSVIERWHPSLVVVGATDDATAERLIRSSTVDVLIARERASTGSVIAGTDFSDPSMPAIRAAAAVVARRGSGELFVAHAVELASIMVYGVELPPVLGVTPHQLLESARARLNETIATLGLQASAVVGVGAPATVLVEAAQAQDAELLVVGTHGRSGLTRFVLGSVAEAVIRRAPCSVLVVRLA